MMEQTGELLPMSISDKASQIDLPIGQWSAHAFGILLGIMGWFALASVFPNQLMPFPQETIYLSWVLIEEGVVWPHLWATLRRTILGFIGTMLVGIALGIIMGLNTYGQRLLIPYMIIGFALPAIAWAAITTLIFSFGDLAPIMTTVLVAYPVVAINIWKGIEDINSDFLYMSEAFGVSRHRIILRTVLPDVAPALFAALRYGLTMAWGIVTIGEMFATSNGIGVMIIQTYQAYRFQEAWAWALVFMGVILLIEYGLFKPLERKVFEYRPNIEFNLTG